MDETTEIEQQLIKIHDYKKIEQNEIKPVDTLKFLDECRISIFDFKKDKNNKIKIVNKKYKLYQYGLTVSNSFIYLDSFTTLKDISIYLKNKGININLKSLIKAKLFKIEIS